MPNNLRKALELSALVWGSPLASDTGTDTQIAYKDQDGERWISFEATDSWRDLITHIQVWPKRFKGSRAHAGFIRAYLSMKPILDILVESSPYTIVWTGHSLGGALAQLACLDLGGRAVATGAPRVWFGRTPLIHLTRYETQEDPIPNLPPFYHHTGNLLLVKSTKKGWRAHIPDAYWEGVNG
jgi:hypothetical protein